ncbi:MAG: activator of (R)-2-hydroxyglutaryl-CoA dehydratase [Acidobacteria bacterium]|nr:activator of (R)-2-hydroxyglutaryl-CoA dehydratase [Acidobacteriota bacterium]
MSTSPNSQLPKPNPGLLQIGSDSSLTSEEIFRQKVAEERRRLEQLAGVEDKPVLRFLRPKEHLFTKDQREHTTLLFGGLTWKHEKLIQGALQALGYKCEPVMIPDKKAFQLGKEYGNNGQCNPTYFTVGNLVQHLQKLEEKGLSKDEIKERYIFLTAGACGPCRFGMYEAEYRLALRNSGFDGFRVMLFQQEGGLNQAEAEAGLEMNLDFFLGILNALNMGDVINDVAYQIRPFEVNAGETARVLDECMNLMYEVIRNKEPYQLEGKMEGFFSRIGKIDTATYLGKFINQLYGNEFTAGLREVRDRFNGIRIDRTQIRPIVKVTGEFWAQTTEGDGNFNMFGFLEKEGAQVIVEPIGTWILYMIHQVIQRLNDEKGLEEGAVLPPAWRLDKHLKINLNLKKKVLKLKLAEGIFKREYNRIIDGLGGLAHHLTDQYELQRLGHPYYNSRAGGGEGHLEVAKNIYYSNKGLCHMVLSLKPFGCMPSTQSDGAQSAVVSKYKDMIFLPIETSGEGDVNAHSRVQMALGEAKAKAKLEFKETLESTGSTLVEIRAFMEDHPETMTPLYKVPHYEGIVGTAAHFIKHIGERIKSEKPALVAV